MSRLLTNLLLLKNNYLFIQYVSFENLIEQKKKTYYEVLMDGQKDRYSEKEKVDKWMLLFLQSLEALIHRLEQKYDVFKAKGGYLNERQKRIKEFIKSNQPIKLSDLVNNMPDISINTLKKDLQYMKIEKIIESVGKNKGTAKVKEDCDVMIDQLRAIDNKRLIKKIGAIPMEISEKVKENLRIILDLDE